MTPKPKPAPDVPKPTICRIVEYRSKTGNYMVPAIVNCTTNTIDPVGVELGHVPELDDAYHVHLTVFTPGQSGAIRNPMASPTTVNAGGTYQEWNIPFDDSAGPGTWRWPARS